MIARRLRSGAGQAFAALLAGLFLLVSAAHAQEKKDKLDLDKIPKRVMDTLKAKFPKAEIDKWTKEKEGNDIVYDIEFKQEGRKFEADIKEDGTLLNWEKEIAAKDLPEAAKKAVEKKYPKSTMKVIMEVIDVKDGKETPGGFEVTLETADKKEVEVVVSADGKITEDSGEKKDEKKKDKQ
jgi:hypothetical protein